MNDNRPGARNVPVRYNPPTRLDLAEYGALLIVSDENEKRELYIQTSWDSDTPKWMTIGGLFAQSGYIDFKTIDAALVFYTGTEWAKADYE